MLYVTTRNQKDAFTVSHVLNRSRGEDGGLYLPLRFPKFTEQELHRLSALSVNQCAAELLNLFFSARLTGWDVDFSTGRYPVRTEMLPHRIAMAEFWHNPQWRYDRLEENLRKLLDVPSQEPGNWVTIAIRMALLAALVLDQQKDGEGNVDIAAVSGDFTDPISAWYLREMGFPVGNIICCCNENNQLWDLICHGQMRTDAAPIPTGIPEADVTRPIHLERLISLCGGEAETNRYLEARKTGSVYSVSDAMLTSLRRGLYVSVVSSSRVENAIPNVYKSHNYRLTPASALAYSGLMDYRTKTGNTGPALVLCMNRPEGKPDTAET